MSAGDFCFNDTYHGPRWTYGARYREIHTANVPAGWIIGSDRAHPDYAFGTIDYPRALLPAEQSAFELEPVAVEAPDPHQPSPEPTQPPTTPEEPRR